MDEVKGRRSRRFADRGASSRMRDVGALVGDATKHVGSGILRHVSVDLVEPDPEQPRTSLRALGITAESVRAHVAGGEGMRLDDPQHPERAEAFARLQDLAISIKAQGLIQPIAVTEVATGEERYVIEEGERRYLAHLINGEQEIQAVVRGATKRVRSTKARQLIENIQREELTAYERVVGLRELNEVYRSEEGREMVAQDIREQLGFGRSMAYCYQSLLSAPEDVLEALRQGRLRGVRDAERVVASKVSTPEERERLIAAFYAGQETPVMEGPGHQSLQRRSNESKPARGRPASRINLGATTDAQAVQNIMRKGLGARVFERQFGAVDWTDFKAVARAWREFLKQVEEKGL